MFHTVKIHANFIICFTEVDGARMLCCFKTNLLIKGYGIIISSTTHKVILSGYESSKARCVKAKPIK